MGTGAGFGVEKRSVEERVKQVISECPEFDDGKMQIKPESNFVDDFGFDSLSTPELINRLEDEFQIEISDDDEAKIQTFQQAVDYLKERGFK